MFRPRRRLLETRVDSSRDEFIRATIEITAPVYMTGETRRVEISPRMKFQLALSSRDEMQIANVIRRHHIFQNGK